MAGAWENVTGETEEGQCIRDFQKLDPHFNKVCSVVYDVVVSDECDIFSFMLCTLCYELYIHRRNGLQK